MKNRSLIPGSDNIREIITQEALPGNHAKSNSRQEEAVPPIERSGLDFHHKMILIKSIIFPILTNALVLAT